MSNFRAPVFNPSSRRVEEADWLDNHFGNYAYGISFDDGAIHRYNEVGIEAAGLEIERLRAALQEIAESRMPGYSRAIAIRALTDRKGDGE